MCRYKATASVTDVVPRVGIVDGGEWLTVYGMNFGTDESVPMEQVGYLGHAIGYAADYHRLCCRLS